MGDVANTGYSGYDFALGVLTVMVAASPPPKKRKEKENEVKQEILTELVLCDLRSLSLFSGGMGGDI